MSARVYSFLRLLQEVWCDFLLKQTGQFMLPSQVCLLRAAEFYLVDIMDFCRQILRFATARLSGSSSERSGVR